MTMDGAGPATTTILLLPPLLDPSCLPLTLQELEIAGMVAGLVVEKGNGTYVDRRGDGRDGAGGGYDGGFGVFEELVEVFTIGFAP